MKTQPVPTAPALRQAKTTRQVTPRVGWLVLTLSLSMVGGIVAGLFAATYYPAILRVPDVVLVNREADSISTPHVFNESVIVSVFPADTTDWLVANELAKGVIVSTDGWIVTTASAESVANGEVVLSDGRRFTITQALTDPYSSVTFVKIATTQLPVIDFITNPPALGETVTLLTTSITSGPRVTFTTLENTQFNDTDLYSSTTLNQTYLIAEASRAEYNGSPILNSAGQLVGLNQLDHQVIPAPAIAQSMYTIFRDGSITAREWDFSYQPTVRLLANTGDGYGQGATVAQINVADSPLLPGDVILTIEGDAITPEHDVAALLHQYTVGQTITIHIERKGVEQDLDVTLY